MPVQVRIPTPLRRLTNDQDLVTVEASTVAEMIEKLEEQFPGVKQRLYDESGQLRQFINIFVDGEDIRFLNGLETPLKESSEVSIIPAIAGGIIN
ncbi:MAG: ubiquitin-like small modifier protein 1 [Armatimonadota bacterium]|nr:MoaD/ThiS family protein [Armatimonadota bacterium]MCX7777548.1 MoaD/ThiS family protein [Armatimonadota bacterium]MDW8025557.1 ubiquitin-like small modifier protein 1 [Armatimonadota bacterium]